MQKIDAVMCRNELNVHLPPRFPAAKAIKYAEANPGVTRLGIDPKQGITSLTLSRFLVFW